MPTTEKDGAGALRGLRQKEVWIWGYARSSLARPTAVFAHLYQTCIPESVLDGATGPGHDPGQADSQTSPT